MGLATLGQGDRLREFIAEPEIESAHLLSESELVVFICLIDELLPLLDLFGDHYLFCLASNLPDISTFGIVDRDDVAVTGNVIVNLFHPIVASQTRMRKA